MRASHSETATKARQKPLPRHIGIIKVQSNNRPHVSAVIKMKNPEDSCTQKHVTLAAAAVANQTPTGWTLWSVSLFRCAVHSPESPTRNKTAQIKRDRNSKKKVFGSSPPPRYVRIVPFELETKRRELEAVTVKLT